MASNVTFKWNPGWEKHIEEQIRKSPLQKQVNERSQAIVRGVNAEMKGGDVEAIFETLMSRLRAEKFQPYPDKMREVAQVIANKELV
ncbi:MAG: hypothetical protein WED09_05435 [Homoserinimonas sp.]